MKYTKLGRSNLTVSRICLGTMHFAGATPEAEAFRIMDRALELGINLFDTANIYGGYGGTETIIGNWLQQGNGRRDRIVLATKVYQITADPSIPNEEVGISAYKVRKHAADSLRRLQTDHIDLYQVHHIDRRVSGEEFWGAFERLVNNGDVIYMGSSNFPGWGLAKHQMQALQRGFLGLISEQTQYNLLSRYPELEVIPAAYDLGIGILAYMPLGGGLLTGKARVIEGSRTFNVAREYGLRLSGNEQLAAFSALCRELGEKESTVAIAWTLSNPAVSSAIVGIRTVEHLEGIERAAELTLSPEVLMRLDRIFDINHGRAMRPGPAPEAFAW
jgi:aryl-alcohol dehydrogenase-like predicted oxidoreductase